MAVNETRSMNYALLEGETDGKYRKEAPNREETTADALTSRSRENLHPDYGYGHDPLPVNRRVAPDGTGFVR